MKTIALWSLHVLLAAVYLAHGAFLIAPPASMVEIVNASIGPTFRVFIGVAEVLAAIGLIAPGVTRIMPWLTVWAAGGLMVVMGSATVFVNGKPVARSGDTALTCNDPVDLPVGTVVAVGTVNAG